MAQRRNDSLKPPSGGGVQEIRRAVKKEQEQLRVVEQLSDGKFNQLFGIGAYIPAMIKAQREAKEEEDKFKELERTKESKFTTIVQKTEDFKNNLEERKSRIEKQREDQMKQVEAGREEEERRIDYALQRETESLKERTKIKMEAKKEFDRLDDERRKRIEEKEEEKARKRKKEREEDYKLMTEMEKSKIQTQAKIDRETEVEMADHRFKEELRIYEATKEDEDKYARDLLTMEWEYQKQMNQQRLDALTNFFSGEQGKDRAYNIARLTALSMTIVGAVMVTVPIASKWLSKFLFAPKLVNRQVKYSKLGDFVSSYIRKRKDIKVVLPPSLEQRMDRLLTSTRATGERHGIYGNLLLYGRPGTGKTLWAEKLAQEAKMDFAVMSGPSFEQFDTSQSIQEIRNLFDWAKTRKKGVLLFVDEADSFLEDRNTLHPHRVSVLNEWINQTGTESSNFMCVYETNRPEVLDPAIQSRVSASVEFVTPEERELSLMLRHYIDEYVTTSSGVSCPYLNDEANIEEIAKQLAKLGFVGRDVSNLAINLFKAAVASENKELTEEMVREVIEEQREKKATEQRYLEMRNQRLADHQKKLLSAYL